MNLLPFGDVKVVIIGQNPYHGPGQAHGLCFSVLPGVEPPPSLKNIFREIQTDLEIAPANHGCLTSWAQQGVLLLNSVLTVEQNRAASHQGKGWERFTDVIIQRLNSEHSGRVFFLWGSYAQKKRVMRRYLPIQAYWFERNHGFPFKCPVAPLEFVYLADAYYRARPAR